MSANSQPKEDLERAYIREYLRNQGHTLESVQKLSEQEKKELMTAACRYAALKMAEIESRARFAETIHGE